LDRRAVVRDLTDERILITAGATREAIDPVRFLSNRSSGRMGFALAEAARQRGARVTVVAGVTTVDPPVNMDLIRTQSAEEMKAAVLREIGGASIFVAAAAVADYRPLSRSETKIKKTASELVLTLERTPDILGEVATKRSDGLLVIGFAAETDNVVQHAREKLHNKKLDAVVANDVNRTDAGFDADKNAVTIITRDHGDGLELPLMSKLAAAHRILDEIIRLRAQKRDSVAASHVST